MTAFKTELKVIGELASVNLKDCWLDEFHVQKKPTRWFSRWICRLWFCLTRAHKDTGLLRTFDKVTKMIESNKDLLKNEEFLNSLERFYQNVKTVTLVRNKGKQELWVRKTFEQIESVRGAKLIPKVEPTPVKESPKDGSQHTQTTPSGTKGTITTPTTITPPPVSTSSDQQPPQPTTTISTATPPPPLNPTTNTTTTHQAPPQSTATNQEKSETTTSAPVSTNAQEPPPPHSTTNTTTTHQPPPQQPTTTTGPMSISQEQPQSTTTSTTTPQAMIPKLDLKRLSDPLPPSEEPKVNQQEKDICEQVLNELQDLENEIDNRFASLKDVSGNITATEAEISQVTERLSKKVNRWYIDPSTLTQELLMEDYRNFDWDSWNYVLNPSRKTHVVKWKEREFNQILFSILPIMFEKLPGFMDDNDAEILKGIFLKILDQEPSLHTQTNNEGKTLSEFLNEMTIEEGTQSDDHRNFLLEYLGNFSEDSLMISPSQSVDSTEKEQKLLDKYRKIKYDENKPKLLKKINDNQNALMKLLESKGQIDDYSTNV